MCEATLARSPRKGKAEGWDRADQKLKLKDSVPTEEFGARGSLGKSGVSGWVPIRCSWKTRVGVEDGGLPRLVSLWKLYVETSVMSALLNTTTLGAVLVKDTQTCS